MYRCQVTCVSCAKPIADTAVICPHCRALQRVAPPEMGPGTHIERGEARIVVEKRIGSGAMGNVFSGWLFHSPTGPHAGVPPELVALKQLRREVRKNDEIRTLFRNEAQALGLLSHPNVVRFLDLFEWTPPPARAKTEPVSMVEPPKTVKKAEPALTLVMEFVQGDALDEVVARNVARARLANVQGCLLPARAFQYFEQLVGGLSAAHARGIIHRDVKPSNIMIRKDGLVKLTDFGIAYFQLPSGSADAAETMAPGTGAYMSPEQVMGLPVDGRSDFYSAAIVLYEMLAGRAPFSPDEQNELGLRVAQVETPPPSILNFVPAAPPALAAFFVRALSKSVAQRFANAADLVQAAGAALGLAPSPGWQMQKDFASFAGGRAGGADPRLTALRGAVEQSYRTQAMRAAR
jgi:serine/threonine-protein kinase